VQKNLFLNTNNKNPMIQMKSIPILFL